MPTLLSYRIDPDPSPLQTAATARLKVIVSNSSRTDKVVVKSLKIVLSVGENQFDLTNTPGSINVAVQGDSGWSIERAGGTFTLSKNVPPVIDSLQIVLSSLAVNNSVGRSVVKIYEVARYESESDWSAETKFEQDVWKESQELWIRNFQATPPAIRSGGSTTLTWDASPRATLKLRFDRDGRGVKEIPVTDKGGSYRVDDVSRHGEVRFELVASLRGEELQAERKIDVGRRLPKIIEFSGRRGNDGALYVTWRTESANRCALSGRSDFQSMSGRDVRIESSSAFVYLTAYNADDESVVRDLFEYKEKDAVRLPKPLPPPGDWAVQLGCSSDGSHVFFNEAIGERTDTGQVFHIGRTSDFPTTSARQPGKWLAFRADGSQYAVLHNRGARIFDLSNQQVREVTSPDLFSTWRVDFAPDDWGMVVSGVAAISPNGMLQLFWYDVDGQSSWEKEYWLDSFRPKDRYLGLAQWLGRNQRLYLEFPPDRIRSILWKKSAPVVSLGGPVAARVAAIVADHRDTAYAAIPDLNEVAIFDGNDPGAGVQRRLKVGHAPTGLALTATEVIVANSGDPFLTVIDIDSQTVMDPIPMPEPMCAVAVARKQGMIFTYAAARNRVVRFVSATRPPKAKRMAALSCRIASLPDPVQAGQPATLFAIVTNESDVPAGCKRVSVNGTSFDADASIAPGGEIVFPWRFDAPAKVGPMNVDVVIDDASHSFRVDVFPAGFVIDQFDAVPEEVPPNGRATLVWRVSGPRSEEARFTIAAPGMNEVAVGAEGLHSIDVTAAKTSVVLRAELDGIVTERTAVIRTKG